MSETDASVVPNIGQLLTKTVTVTTAQLRALFSSPVPIFQAQPGIGYRIDRGLIHKPVCNTPFTIGSAGNADIKAGSLTLTGSFAPAGFFDTTAARTYIWSGFGGSGIYPIMLLETQLQNVAISLTQATADMTGGDGSLIVVVQYRIFTSVPSLP